VDKREDGKTDFLSLKISGLSKIITKSDKKGDLYGE
jgi:hypothetical protein